MLEFVKAFGMFLSLAMCLFLITYSYMEAMRFSNSEGKVKAGTFLFSVIMGVVFGLFANHLYT